MVPNYKHVIFAGNACRDVQAPAVPAFAACGKKFAHEHQTVFHITSHCFKI